MPSTGMNSLWTKHEILCSLMRSTRFKLALFRVLTVNKGKENNYTHSHTGNYYKERNAGVNLIHLINNLGQGEEWTFT